MQVTAMLDVTPQQEASISVLNVVWELQIAKEKNNQEVKRTTRAHLPIPSSAGNALLEAGDFFFPFRVRARCGVRQLQYSHLIDQLRRAVDRSAIRGRITGDTSVPRIRERETNGWGRSWGRGA